MTREEILAIRATGLALVAQCDAALARVAPITVTATSGVQPAAEPSCEHAEVINTSVPGFPHRAKCKACGQTVYPVPT